MEQEFSLWVGIDWATEEHQVCGVDRQGKKLFECKVRHEGEDIARFVEELLEKVDGRAEQVAVAIETPRGSIVEALMDRGVAAFSINPKQLDRFRDRYTVGGAKSDKLDAFVMSDTLRTDFKLYRRIEFGDPVVVQMRELSRVHDALSQDARALGSRLREQLVRYFPQVLALGSVYDEAWLWDLLELAPTPTDAARLSQSKVAAILRQRRVRRVKADMVIEKLREKALVVAPGVVEAASAHVRLLLPLLRLANQQLGDCDHRIAGLLEKLRGAAEPSTSAEGGARGAKKAASRRRHPPVLAWPGGADERHDAVRGRDRPAGPRLPRPACSGRRRARQLADGQTASTDGHHAPGVQPAPAQRDVPLGARLDAARCSFP